MSKQFTFDVTATARFGVTIDADSLEEARAKMIAAMSGIGDAELASDFAERLFEQHDERLFRLQIGALVTEYSPTSDAERAREVEPFDDWPNGPSAADLSDDQPTEERANAKA